MKLLSLMSSLLLTSCVTGHGNAFKLGSTTTISPIELGDNSEKYHQQMVLIDGCLAYFGEFNGKPNFDIRSTEKVDGQTRLRGVYEIDLPAPFVDFRDYSSKYKKNKGWHVVVKGEFVVEDKTVSMGFLRVGYKAIIKNAKVVHEFDDVCQERAWEDGD